MFNKKIILILTIILVSLLAVSAVNASEISSGDEVSIDEDNPIIEEASDDILDDSQENIISAKDDGTFTALQDKINSTSEGATISLENDYAYDEGFDTEGILIDKDITINGNGHTIDALSKSRIFLVDTNKIIFNNIVFKNGRASVAYETSFSPGSAIKFTNVVSGNINNCSFVENRVETIIIHNSNCNISYCNFMDSSGINFYNSNGSIVNSNFVNSGIIDLNGNDNVVSNSNFTNSPIMVSGKNSIICDCMFEKCISDGCGGAITIFYGADNTLIRGSYFSNNFADIGGAIVSEILYTDCSIVNCTFINNSASWSGGAIENCYRVADCTFINNSADNFGGAIASGEIIENCIFINNNANGGGAASTCTNVLNCIFANNSASEYGGAISYVRNAEGCNFENNSADYGGAIFASNARNCNFTNNYAKSGSIIAYNILDSNLKYYNKPAAGIGLLSATYSDDIQIFRIVDCNIQENGLNNYHSIELIGSELIIKSLQSNLYAISVKVLDTTYEPYSYEKHTVNETSTYDAHINLDNLSAGNWDAFIHLCSTISSGDTIYRSIVDINIPIWIPHNYELQSSDISKYYGAHDEYAVTLTCNGEAAVNESININANGEIYLVKTNENGQAVIDLDLPVGEHDITATYGNISTASKFIVKSTLTTADEFGEYLNAKVNAIFLNTDGNPLANSKVAFKVNNNDYTTSTNANGIATANIDLNAGTYTVTAVNPVNSEEKEFKLLISKSDSGIALTSSQNNGITSLTATLTPATATGNVVFNVNGEDKSATIKNGKATLTLSDLEPGNYAVTASYNGDKNLNASISSAITFNVAKAYPILTAENLTKTYGAADNFVVNLIDSRGNAIANAVVNVNIKDKVTPITTGSDGQATMPIVLAPATYTATVTYGSDAQTTAKIIVKKATPKLTAKAKTFKKSVKTKKYTVTLKTNQNKVMKNTKVTIKVNKKTYTSKTNKKGIATFKITKLTKKGKYTATVTYKGSTYYNKLTKKVKITVK